MPVLKGQTAVRLTSASESWHSENQGRSGNNNGSQGKAPLPPANHFSYSTQPPSNAAGRETLLFPSTRATFQFLLTPSTCMVRAYLLVREKEGKAEKVTSE